MLNDGDNILMWKHSNVYVLIEERVVHMTSNNTNTNSVCEKFVTA